MTKAVTLRVAETTQQDVGSGRARVDTKTRMELGLSPGDVIEVRGSKTTAARRFRERLTPTTRGSSTCWATPPVCCVS